MAIDYGGVAGPDWYGAAAMRAAAATPSGEVVVVAHSGAGGLIPSLADSLGHRLVGLMLVDAVIPHPGLCWFDTASAGLASRVRGLASHGLLPPWDTWFDRDAIARLVPDPAVLGGFRAELPRVPLAYLEALAPEGRVWEALPIAYLQLSEAYAAEASAAALRGWTVRREPLHHLAMLSHPDRVAAAVADLAREIV